MILWEKDIHNQVSFINPKEAKEFRDRLEAEGHTVEVEEKLISKDFGLEWIVKIIE